MTDLTHLIQSGSAYVWLYVPVAIVLGALHGLEPGHSKTMMAAFIIAIRGTIGQAILLGLSAAISHSLLIWLLAALALGYGGKWQAEDTEPYFQIASAVMILGLALWMFVRTRREVAESHAHQSGHDHVHSHAHSEPRRDAPAAPFEAPSPRELRELGALSKPQPDDINETDPWSSRAHSHAGPSTTPPARVLSGEALTAGGLIVPAGMVAESAVASVRSARLGRHRGVLLDTGHGWLEILIHEEGAPPRFRIYPCKASGDPVPLPRATRVSVDTARLDGSTQKFALEARDGFWESAAEVPEPHEFVATITLGHSDHAHTYRLRFIEEQGHQDAAQAKGHGHGQAIVEEPEDDGVEYQDAHERAHAQDIARRFTNRAVTTPQIILFGITGGLMPCPAAFTVLLICLQIKKVTLGFTMVASFSFGLALTMVAVGVIAAWSIQKAHKRFRGFGEWMRKAPYISCLVLILLAAVMGWQGAKELSHPHLHHRDTGVAP